MLSQIHMAKSATFAFERKLMTISDNVANAQTVGYKQKRVEFENLFPLVLSRAVTEFEDANIPVGQRRKKFFEYGQGVRIAAITKDMRQGTIEVTNRSLDVAVQGKGFLQFRLPDGRVAYTRAGNLHQDNEGNITNTNGHLIEPSIRLPQNTTDVIINEQGKVYAQVNNEAQPQQVGQITLAIFPNEEGLVSMGQNLYRETAASGLANLESPGSNAAGTVKQRALEFSNVNVIEQLISMLTLQRTFDVSMKAIKSADEILKSGADIK